MTAWAATSVLLIGYVWPEPTSSAAGVRDWDLIRIFKKTGWKITFTSPSAENDFSRRIREEGIETRSIPPNDPGFDDFIRALKPDFVIFDRFVTEEQFGWRVAEHSPGTVRIVDTQDLHFLRRARQAAFERSAPAPGLPELLTEEDAYREVASIYRSDLTLILSAFEFELLCEQFRVPEKLLMLQPFCYPKPPKPTDFGSRRNFVTIGNFRHPPNADAAAWLKKEIWPRIRRALPDAEVHLYGAYPSREVMALTDPAQGFIVKGPAEDQYQTLARYRVNLAPLRFGAGIKGKISDGWWSGTPVVTTPIGAEGMTGKGGFGGLVTGSSLDPEEFARLAVDLHNRDDLWTRCQSAGQELLHELLDFEVHSEALPRRMLELQSSLAERRRENFIGGMLRHHAHKSTTYFSKWIELKNQLKPKPTSS